MYRLLADAGRILASSLDFDTTLANVSRLIIPEMADWFAVDLVSEAGTLERAHVSHQDPVKLALAHELFARYPPQRNAPRGQWSVIQTGRPEWSANIDDAWLQSMAVPADYRKAIAGLALRSYILVPLSVEGGIVGVLTVVHAESGRCYDQSDIEPFEQLGALVGLAVRNARTHTRLRELTERKDEFLATLAHELRNPLAPIVTAAHLLDSAGDDPAQVRNIAAVIQRQSRHMSALVEDLLDVVRVGRGDYAFLSDQVDLADVVHAAVEQVRPELLRREHRLEVSGVDDRLCVKGDRTRLVQIVANLLTNAVRYTPDGGMIRIAVMCDGGDALIQVCDNGIGISREFLPHVFDLFSQQSRGPERQQGGLGLGLTLVRRLVDRHGGTVRAESNGPGSGSCFTVRLPKVEGCAQSMPDDVLPISRPAGIEGPRAAPLRSTGAQPHRHPASAAAWQ